MVEKSSGIFLRNTKVGKVKLKGGSAFFRLLIPIAAAKMLRLRGGEPVQVQVYPEERILVYRLVGPKKNANS